MIAGRLVPLELCRLQVTRYLRRVAVDFAHRRGPAPACVTHGAHPTRHCLGRAPPVASYAERRWLAAFAAGATVSEIATDTGQPYDRVQWVVKRAVKRMMTYDRGAVWV